MKEPLEQLSREINNSVQGLDAAQMQLRTENNASRWSIQQIVEHLNLTYTSSAEVCAVRLAKGTPTKASPSLQQRLGQWVLIGMGRFPKGRQAPAMVAPGECAPLSGEALASRSRELLERFDGLMNDAERLFGRKRSISHMVLGPLSAEQWRRFHLIHGQHHLKQIAAIRAANGLSSRAED